jgi:hypothetical protein
MYYEVLMGGASANPYPFLTASALSLPQHGGRDLPF